METNTNNVYTHFPYADCAADDFVAQYLRKGLQYFVRGAAAALLAPLELLKTLQVGRPVGRKVALSWTLSAVMTFCAIGIYSLSSSSPISGASRAGVAWLLSLAIVVIGVVNGRVQSVRAEAKRLVMMDLKRRAA